MRRKQIRRQAVSFVLGLAAGTTGACGALLAAAPVVMQATSPQQAPADGLALVESAPADLALAAAPQTAQAGLGADAMAGGSAALAGVLALAFGRRRKPAQA